MAQQASGTQFASTSGFTSDINEEMLRQFEEEFEQHRLQLERARETFKHKKTMEIQRQIESMQSGLMELENQVKSNRDTRKSLRLTLMEKKAKIQTQMVAQQHLKRDTWHLERSHQLEEAAQKRLELEKIQEERQNMVQRHAIHMIEIQIRL